MPMQMTVTRQGTTTEFESRFDSNRAAAEHLITLTLSGQPLARNPFAESLARTYGRSRRLSDRQWPWVHFLVYEHEQREAEAAAAPAEPAYRLPELMNMLNAAAGSGLRRPAIALTLEDRTELRFAYNARGRNPGSGGIVHVDRYGNDRFAGYVMPDGAVQCRSLSTLPDNVRAEIERLSEMTRVDLIQHLADNGRRGGRCQFCRRPLSTAESLTVGYGPVCASRYGLPWGHVSVEGVSSQRPRRRRRPVTEDSLVENENGTLSIERGPEHVYALNDPRPAAERRRNPADADDEWV